MGLNAIFFLPKLSPHAHQNTRHTNSHCNLKLNSDNSQLTIPCMDKGHVTVLVLAQEQIEQLKRIPFATKTLENISICSISCICTQLLEFWVLRKITKSIIHLSRYANLIYSLWWQQRQAGTHMSWLLLLLWMNDAWRHDNSSFFQCFFFKFISFSYEQKLKKIKHKNKKKFKKNVRIQHNTNLFKTYFVYILFWK